MSVYLNTFLVLVIGSASNSLFAQQTMRIVVTPTDSVYKWDNGESSGSIRTFSIQEGTVIYLDKESRRVSKILPIAGRGSNVGLETWFYPNGMIERQGHNGYTTTVDSLKQASSDGHLNNVDKVGWWYYWNESGFLVRKERWNRGKLEETIFFQTIREPKSTRKQKR